MNIRVIDNFVPNPREYRQEVLGLPFMDVPAGDQVFRGMAFSSVKMDCAVPIIRGMFAEAKPIASFFRKSPLGQIEPNDIHSDSEMGDWTGILYLNPEPPRGDGTCFWRHSGTDAKSGEEWRKDGHFREEWSEVCRVPAVFNRLLLFDAKLFHSRAIVENYGEGDNARLIQVIFGKGVIPWQ